jgi:hypothetical protein
MAHVRRPINQFSGGSIMPSTNGVGHAREACLADQNVEAERGQIVGQGLERGAFSR